MAFIITETTDVQATDELINSSYGLRCDWDDG